MQQVQKFLEESLGSVFTAAQVEIRQRGAVIYRAAIGSLDSEGKLTEGSPKVQHNTVFDFASLTKLFTTSALLRLIDSGRLSLTTPICEVLPDFTGMRPIESYDNPLVPGEKIQVVPPTAEKVNAAKVTFRDLLTHSSGLPAWINLRLASDLESCQAMILGCPFAYPTGATVVYSDVGFMLIGMALEKLMNAPLQAATKRLVMRPLELDILFGPIIDSNVPPTEFCQWRRRRIQGEVHDENAATLNGIAGHAGLFGTARDVAILGQTYLADGGGFISPRLAHEATRRQVGDRGLGWMMRSPEGSSSGARFSPESYGHTGFVGNSVWVDPNRKLVVALLTNNVFYGRDRTSILKFRPQFHDLVIQALEG